MRKITKERIYKAVERDNGFHPKQRVTDWYLSGDELVFCTNKKSHETEHYSAVEFVRVMAEYFAGLDGCDVLEVSGDYFIFKTQKEK